MTGMRGWLVIIFTGIGIIFALLTIAERPTISNIKTPTYPAHQAEQFTTADSYHDVAGGVVLHGVSGQCYDLVIGRYYPDTGKDEGAIRMVAVKERSCE